MKISKEAKDYVEAQFSKELDTAQSILELQLQTTLSQVAFKSQAHAKNIQHKTKYIERLISTKVSLYIQAYQREGQIIDQADYDEMINGFESLVKSHIGLIGTEYTNVFSGLSQQQAAAYERRLIMGYKGAVNIAKRELKITMTEMRVKEKERMRKILLLAVYRKSNGSERKAVPFLDIAGEEGITELEAIDYLSYLEAQRLVKDKGYPGMVSITHEGLLEVEKYYGLQVAEKSTSSLLESKDHKLQLEGEVKQLTSVVDKLILRPSINVQGGYKNMGDTYENYGQTAGMGQNVHAHDNTFNQQVVNHFEKSFDLPALAKQLAELRMEMAKDSSPQSAIAQGEAARAEIAAESGDTSKVMEHLKAAGGWTLDFAKEVGKDVVVAAIKASMGMS